MRNTGENKSREDLTFKSDFFANSRAKEQHTRKDKSPATPGFEKKSKAVLSQTNISPIVKSKENKSPFASKLTDQGPKTKSTAALKNLGHPKAKNDKDNHELEKRILQLKKQTIGFFEDEEKEAQRARMEAERERAEIEEEQRQAREAKMKCFADIVDGVIRNRQVLDKLSLLEYLRKYSKVYTVQLDYGIELNRVWQKKRFLSQWKEAVRLYRYRFKLIRNFARFLNLHLRDKVKKVLEDSISVIK